MAAELEVVPGWYGKIPYLGDFASRRLPQPFVAAWDAWLQQSMTASRAQLGARWLEVYLHSPIWRFVLLPGVIGPELWAGLTMPSVDKVGRHFPLTIAVPLEPRSGLLATVIAAGNWYAEIEDIALATLNIDFPVEQFEARLADAPFQDALSQPSDGRATDLAVWWQRPNGHFEAALPAGWTTQHAVCAAAAEWFQLAGAGKSLWWHESATAGQSRLMGFNAMPHADFYASLLQGHDATMGAAPLVAGVTTAGP